MAYRYELRVVDYQGDEAWASRSTCRDDMARELMRAEESGCRDAWVWDSEKEEELRLRWSGDRIGGAWILSNAPGASIKDIATRVSVGTECHDDMSPLNVGDITTFTAVSFRLGLKYDDDVGDELMAAIAVNVLLAEVKRLGGPLCIDCDRNTARYTGGRCGLCDMKLPKSERGTRIEVAL